MFCILLSLTDYTMIQKDFITALKANANTPSGVIGKPFVVGALYILS